MRLVEEMPLDFTAYYDGEEFIGFTIVYPRKSINWFWYFAVCEKLRGKGYGQKILTQMIEHYKGQSFVLDMESTTQVSENIDQRKHRRDLYLRNGFRDTNVYRTYNDITMTIMMRGELCAGREKTYCLTNYREEGCWVMGDGIYPLSPYRVSGHPHRRYPC